MSQTNYVAEILEKSLEIHLKKRQDYATRPDLDPYENFERSSLIAKWFPNEYVSFAVLIGTKLARLGSLLVKRTAPVNESIEDTFLDLVTYCALFYGYWKSRQISTQEMYAKLEYNPGTAVLGLSAQKTVESCNIHDKYEVGCKDCRSINGLL